MSRIDLLLSIRSSSSDIMSGRCALLLVSLYGRVLLLMGEKSGVWGRWPDSVRIVTVEHCFEMYSAVMMSLQPKNNCQSMFEMISSHWVPGSPWRMGI